eukprot:TRINITY_DN43921_c0_g1_i1.p1 TRINITY_DN43921_c0_g1~~TRINITY_DN43921_c0_g1_i1.p1  ORF type:complete len:406 (+),score=101.45 TRINITY_DN43921_c0_g1_i1:41-1219(+)
MRAARYGAGLRGLRVAAGARGGRWLSAAASAGPQFAVLLASHVNSRRRLDHLCRLLGSLADQAACRPRWVFASISASEAALQREAVGLFSSQRWRGGVETFVLPQPEPRSQFEHFDALRSEVARTVPDDAWLLFSDDDDLWHPLRTLLFAQGVVRALRERPRDVTSVVVPVYCRNSGEIDNLPTAGELHVSPSVVERLIGQGHIERVAWSPQNAVNVPHLECWLHAVQPPVFRRFMDGTTAAQRKHKFCDFLFSAFFRRQWGAGGRTLYSVPAYPSVWSYFHRQHAHQITKVFWEKEPVTAADRALAAEMLPPPAPGQQERLWQHAANLRQDSEMLVLTGETEPGVVAHACLAKHSCPGLWDVKPHSGWARAVDATARATLAQLRRGEFATS